MRGVSNSGGDFLRPFAWIFMSLIGDVLFNSDFEGQE